MKGKITLSMALASLAMTIHAQNWTAPTLKVSADAIPDSAYLYHVGQQKFLTKGTTWGTHAALTDDAGSAMLYFFQGQSDGAYKLHSKEAANTGYLGRSTAKELYTDFDSQTAWSTEYALNKVGQWYQIKTSENSANFGKASDETNETNYNTYLMGWSSTNDDVTNGGESLGTNVGIFMFDPKSEEDGEMQFDWGFVLMSDYNQYAAKQSLYNKLLEAYEEGANTDAASAVYNNDAATIEEINQAIGQLNKALEDIKQGKASEDNPVDMTDQYLVNADFSQGSLNGWTKDGNVLVYAKGGQGAYPNGSLNDGGRNNGEIFDHVIAGWTSGANNGHLGDENIYQTIESLPAGKYVLKASVVGQHANDVPVGIYLYANGVTESQIEVQHADGVWDECVAAGTTNQVIMHPELEIVHAGGSLTIGLKLENTNCNWVYAGKFQLICKGQTDMSAYALALQQTVTSAQPYENQDVYKYSETLNEQLTQQLDAANDLLGSGASDEELQAATTKLKQLVDDIKAEVTAYSNLQAQIETLKSDMERYEDLTGLHTTLSDWFDTYDIAYEDGSISTAEIEAWIAQYDTTILNAVKEAMSAATEEAPVEVTALAKNMDFADNSKDEWTVEVTTSNGGEGFKVNYHNGEVWNNAFSALKSLENMPAGKYKLTAKAFYRTADNATGYADYTAGNGVVLTNLVLGDAKAPVVNQAAGAIEAAEAPANGYAQTADGSGIWLPNSQAAAEYAFNLDDTFLSEVEGYLTKDGELTFGLSNTGITNGNGNNAWSIWTDLRLYYYGVSTDALYNQMMNLSDQANELSSEIGSLIQNADDKLQEAIGAAENLSPESSEEEMINVINQINEAIEYGNAGLALIPEVQALYETYNEKIDEIESDYEGFPDLLSTIGDVIDSEEFGSNEQMQEWLEALPQEWANFVKATAEGATKDDPKELTALLANPSFDQGTNNNSANTGWTREFTTEGGHVGIASEAAQTESDYTCEFWKVKTFDMYQEVKGLDAGYYRVSANVMYRSDSNNDATLAAYLADRDAVNHVSLYANSRAVKVGNLYDEATTTQTGATGEVTATVDGTAYYVIGTQAAMGGQFAAGKYLSTIDVYVAEGETLKLGLRLDVENPENRGNWCVFDNFQLFYLGDGEENMPDAVNGVKAATDSAQAIYDLQGRKVQKAQKGLYIINGNKVLVK